MSSSFISPDLKFKNNKFKIVQFTDLHWIESINNIKNNDSTLQLIRHIIKIEKPDLVIFTGDIVIGKDAAEAWKKVTQPLIEFQVPFAVAFGNHDTETDMTKQQALKVIRTNPFNVTYNSDDCIAGMGNCALVIKDNEGKLDKWVIYMFDSHSYITNNEGYDWIKDDQIQWYRKHSIDFTKVNGNTLPSLAFFHIPTPEFEWVRNQNATVGNTSEQVCSPYLNSGLFSSFVKMKDVLGVFVGHDHNNDFVGVLDNICLGYGRKTGYVSAYEEILERGCRIIELYENDRKINTYIKTLHGKHFKFSFKQKQ